MESLNLRGWRCAQGYEAVASPSASHRRIYTLLRRANGHDGEQRGAGSGSALHPFEGRSSSVMRSMLYSAAELPSVQHRAQGSARLLSIMFRS